MATFFTFLVETNSTFFGVPYRCTALAAQQDTASIYTSYLYKKNTVQLFNQQYLHQPPASVCVYDTIKASFVLTNNFDTDTTIYYTEGPNDWFSFLATPIGNNGEAIQKIGGRMYYGKIDYENMYYPILPLSVKANTSYQCLVQWKSNSYKGANTGVLLLSPEAHKATIPIAHRFFYTNHIINFFFTGAIFFGFFLFLFLYYKSRYKLFGLYAAFLFTHGIYGIVLADVNTRLGSMFITHFNWDEYVTELIVFAGQAIYVQFLIGWLQIKQVSNRLSSIFNSLSWFFLGYAIFFFTAYLVAPEWQVLSLIKTAVRVLGLLFQLFLFYHIFFTIKTQGRWYIFMGNLLLMCFGIVMIFIRQSGVLENTWLGDIDNASWYILGVLGENLCFTMGMGQHYFELQNEKNKLQIAALTDRQKQLETEEQNLQDRLRISQDLHDNIGSTLSSIAVYSKVAIIHSEKNEPESLQEMLEIISSTSNEMVDDMNDIVWAIKPSNDSMEKIMQRMESFARPLAAARNIVFHLNIDESVHSLQMDMGKRKNFYLIFKEAVTNAIKYSGASELKANIFLTNNALVLQVNDNGVGFNMETEMNGRLSSLSGNGLRNMQARATELNGKLTIHSHAGKGTCITLNMPLG